MPKFQGIDSKGKSFEFDAGSSGEALKNTNLGSSSGVRELSDTSIGSSLNSFSKGSLNNEPPVKSSFDNFNDNLSKSLSNELEGLGTSADREKSILEKFADRRTLAKEGGGAERELIEGDAKGSITEQLESNSRNLIDFGDRRIGGATNKVALEFIVDTGQKRVRELEKARDSLLLQSKVAEAGRLDNLIAQEEEAITNSRRSFIENLMNIGREGRDIESFETPEQARQSGFDFATKEVVQNLAFTAPDAGISGIDTYEEAITKYRESGTYKRDVRAGELAIQQAEANIADTQKQTRQRGLSSSSSSGLNSSGLNESGKFGSDLDATVSNVLNNISTKHGKEAFRESIKNARSEADAISAIANSALESLSTPMQDDFLKQAQAVNSIDRAISILDNGLKTGVLNSGLQYTYNIGGVDFDPKLAEINALITSAIQPYRSSITGAAWGAKEDREYEGLFGSSRYQPDELRARLETVKSIMVNKSTTALSTKINPFGRNIFEGQGFGGNVLRNQTTTPSNMFDDDF